MAIPRFTIKILPEHPALGEGYVIAILDSQDTVLQTVGSYPSPEQAQVGIDPVCAAFEAGFRIALEDQRRQMESAMSFDVKCALGA